MENQSLQGVMFYSAKSIIDEAREIATILYRGNLQQIYIAEHEAFSAIPTYYHILETNRWTKCNYLFFLQVPELPFIPYADVDAE